MLSPIARSRFDPEESEIRFASAALQTEGSWKFEELAPDQTFEVKLPSEDSGFITVSFLADADVEFSVMFHLLDSATHAEECLLPLRTCSRCMQEQVYLPGVGTCSLRWRNPKGWFFHAAARIRYYVSAVQSSVEEGAVPGLDSIGPATEDSSPGPTSNLRRMLADLDASSDSSASLSSRSDVGRTPRELGRRARRDGGRLLAPSCSWSSSSSSTAPTPRGPSGPLNTGHWPESTTLRPIFKAKQPPGRPPPPHRPVPGRSQPELPHPPPDRCNDGDIVVGSGGKGKGGKGVAPGPPPGKGKPAKAPPGKAPPGKAPPPGQKAAGIQKDPRTSSALPIGRRLALKPSSVDAEAFRGIASALHKDSDVDSCCERSESEDTGTSVSSVSGGPATPRRSRDSTQTSVLVDFEALRGAFAPQPRQAAQRKPTRARRKELLPRSTAQNVAIALARLGPDGGQELALALRALGSCASQEPAKVQSAHAAVLDGAARLLDVWPEDKVLEPLLEFAQSGRDPSPLRDVERQLLPLLALPRPRQRLRLLVLRGSLKKRTQEAMSQIQLVRSACAEIQASGLLRDLLAVVVLLFNYVNFGAAPAQVSDQAPMRGVDVQSLLRLRETKAFKGEFPGFNMLHFVLQQLLRHRPELRKARLEEEMPSLKRAAKVNVEKLRGELQDLTEDQLFVRAELKEHKEEYNLLSSSDEEAEEPPGSVAGQWTFLERLLARGLDIASLAEAWLRGDEVVGKPYHPEVGALRGFEQVHPEDGGTPPPGWLWLCRPSGRWQRCWSEVRGPVLVLYRVANHRCAGAIYFALPGAAVRQDASSSTNQDEAPGNSEHGPSRGSDETSSSIFALELISSGRLLRLRACSRKEFMSWHAALEEASRKPGAGYLAVSCTEGSCSDSWKGKTLFCAVSGGNLLGFARPRDPLEGAPFVHSWAINCTASLVGSGFQLQQRSDSQPEDDQVWHFACASRAEAIAWLGALGAFEDGDASSYGAPEATQPDSVRLDSSALVHAFGESADRSNALAGLRQQLGLKESSSDLLGPTPPLAQELTVVSDEEPTDTEICSDDNEEGTRRKKGQLFRLEVRIAHQINRWERALLAAEADCGQLLHFFGLLEAGASRQTTCVTAQCLLEAIADLVVQLRAAWEDLEKHDRSKEAKQHRHLFRKRSALAASTELAAQRAADQDQTDELRRLMSFRDDQL
eukprot:TRINITY_DN11267_c0_g2_i1.p1 TRINITY_DN11267_c0_g2~~TRINITY_DN11267_c0_g2_i1.p1  ORF type:complete len:1211 (-),score=244.64 TRINITY_DN11267_c0_g2_i1:119-3715(-)